MKNRRLILAAFTFICLAVAVILILKTAGKRSPEPAQDPQEESTETAVRYTKGIIYDTADGKNCTLDVAYKRDGKEKPLLVCVHGGYYNSGDKAEMYRYMEEFSALGYVTASINYPLLPGATIVGQINSVILAVDYLTKYAGIYEIDNNNINILGFSSGAQIAVTAAEKISEREDPFFILNAIIDISGPTDYRYLNEKYGKANELSSAIIDGNEEADIMEELNKVDCTDNITAKLPKMLVIHGKEDKTVPYEVSERFFDALQAAGVESRISIIDTMGHITDYDIVIPIIKDFLGQGE